MNTISHIPWPAGLPNPHERHTIGYVGESRANITIRVACAAAGISVPECLGSGRQAIESSTRRAIVMLLRREVRGIKLSWHEITASMNREAHSGAIQLARYFAGDHVAQEIYVAALKHLERLGV